MLIQKNTGIIKASEITEQSVFNNRRKLIKAAAASTLAMFIPKTSHAKKYSNIATGKYSLSLFYPRFVDLNLRPYGPV